MSRIECIPKLCPGCGAGRHSNNDGSYTCHSHHYYLKDGTMVFCEHVDCLRNQLATANEAKAQAERRVVELEEALVGLDAMLHTISLSAAGALPEMRKKSLVGFIQRNKPNFSSLSIGQIAKESTLSNKALLAQQAERTNDNGK